MAEQSPETNQSSSGHITSEAIRKRRLFRVGLFALGGFLILAIGIFVIGDRRNLFSKTFKITAYFEDVEGLLSGAGVVVNGIRVGSVTGVKLGLWDTQPDRPSVKVDMVIEEEYQPLIRTGSTAAVGQLGIVGDKQIDIITEDFSDPPVQDNDVIRAAPPANYLAILEKADKAVQNVNNITSSLDTLFIRFRKGEGTLGKLMTDEQVYNNLVGISASAERLFDETAAQFSQFGVLLQSSASNVDDITRESSRLIADLGSGKGTVGAFLHDRQLYDSLESLVSAMTQTAANAGMAAREFGMNMRGLRKNWLVGGLFNGGEDDEANAALQQKALDIQKAELQKKEELLRQRETQAANP